MATEIIDLLRAELEQAQHLHVLAEAEYKRVSEYTRKRVRIATRQRVGARKTYAEALRRFTVFVLDGESSAPTSDSSRLPESASLHLTALVKPA